MCHALTVALQAFEGAVIVVSHDRHLLRNTVDDFLLIADGKAIIFDGDLDDYSRWLIGQRKNDKKTISNNNDSASNKKEQRQQTAGIRKKLNPINNSIKKIEQQMAKTDLTMKKIESELSNSSIYETEHKDKLQQLLQDQVTVSKEKDQQEETWLELNDELENLQQSLNSTD